MIFNIPSLLPWLTDDPIPPQILEGLRVDVPMVGKFDGGRGEFFSQELFEGRHIFSRFIWTVNGPDACHWEQAFSADGGKTWEINWTMTFTRQR